MTRRGRRLQPTRGDLACLRCLDCLKSLKCGGLACARFALLLAGVAIQVHAQQPARTPLDVARVLAARYPESPIMSYIPGVAWAGSLRLSQLTGDAKWLDKPRRDLAPFLSGAKPTIAEPYLLTSLAGHLALADLAAIDRNDDAMALARKAADFIVSDDGSIKYARSWTDDMFMASALLARVGARTTEDRYARAVGRLLTSYADKLQRSDGLFNHAADGPFAWGRGNGFALMGLTEALTFLPNDWPDRAKVLDIYRKHVRAMTAYQAEDGSWRQVVDEPSSYRELTVTAMTVAAMARGLGLGWLDRNIRASIDRGWSAVLARVNQDGTLRDVCSSTGAGATKEYYLNRPAVNGADDRGGAMALLAAIEMEALSRAERR
jgi:unsaturated rhamnogalacturonyl hydrolase